MPMRRNQPLPEPRVPAVMAPADQGRLQAIFRHAIHTALATSLLAAGCSTTHSGAVLDAGNAGSASAAGTFASAGTADVGTSGGSGRGGSSGGAGRAAAGSGSGSGSGGGLAAPSGGGVGGAQAAAAGSGGSSAVGVTCTEAWQPLVGVDPAEPFDYASLRLTFGNGRVTERGSVGTACANAANQASCRESLTALEHNLETTEICTQVSCRHYILTTSGDSAKRYASREEFSAFLGPIDTPADVLLWLDYLGYSVGCVEQVKATADGFEAAVGLTVDLCPVTTADVTVHVAPNGDVTELSRKEHPVTSGVCIGRRPEGLLAAPAHAEGHIDPGAHFAQIATLEAASVTAFEVLAHELELHGAPEALVTAAQRSARDEVRHAAAVGELARRFGALPVPAEIVPKALRSLEAIALDNIVEGCVRETFGAAVGCYQAQTAADPEIRTVMREIASDETRHAALAMQFAAWVAPLLDEAARARVDAARATAIDALLRECRQPVNEALAALAGLPDSVAMIALHATLTSELWNTAGFVAGRDGPASRAEPARG